MNKQNDKRSNRSHPLSLIVLGLVLALTSIGYCSDQVLSANAGDVSALNQILGPPNPQNMFKPNEQSQAVSAGVLVVDTVEYGFDINTEGWSFINPADEVQIYYPDGKCIEVWDMATVPYKFGLSQASFSGEQNLRYDCNFHGNYVDSCKYEWWVKSVVSPDDASWNNVHRIEARVYKAFTDNMLAMIGVKHRDSANFEYFGWVEESLLSYNNWYDISLNEPYAGAFYDVEAVSIICGAYTAVGPLYIDYVRGIKDFFPIPVLISPADGSTTEANFPKFAWQPSTDTVAYSLQVADNSDFAYPIVDESWYGGTDYTVSSSIPNGTYYWRVGASASGELWSGWSAANKFTITGPYSVPSEFPDIRAAIRAIPYSAAGEVLVAPGTYTGHRNCGLSDFDSRSVQLRSSGGPSSTFIDCGDSLRGYYFNWYTMPGTLVEGFTIHNAIGYDGTGGAIDCDGAPVTINNCVIEDCPDGGVFIRNGSQATITNCVVENCFRQGVLISGWSSRATITNCTIKNNEWIGLLTSTGGRATITGSTFQENMGVGLRLDADSNSVITNCDFINNQEGEGGGYGAYIYNSKPTFQSCNFLQNESSGLYSSSSNLNIDNCTFTGNGSSWRGSGIYARNNSVITLTNSTFDGNTARYGAGIFLEAATAYLAQCLFDGNTASSAGGAVYVNWGSIFSASGCTFVNNSSPTGSAVYIEENVEKSKDKSEPLQALGGAGISKCLFAYNQQSAPVHLEPYAWVEIMCSNIYGNPGGDWVGAVAPYSTQDGNMSADPLFCDADNNDYSLFSTSPVAADNSSCGTIGAFDVGCAVVEFSLSLDPDSMVFEAYVGGSNPPAQNLQINVNPDGSSLNWTLSKHSDWLLVSSMDGTAPSTVSISVNKTGLLGGVYYDTLVVVSNDAINSPQTIPVTLTLIGGEIAISSTSFAFAMNYGDPNPLDAQILTVTNSGSGTLSCQLSNGQAWLQLSPTEFSAPQQVYLIIDPTGLIPGTYEDTILIVSEYSLNSPQIVPVTFTLTAGGIAISPTSLNFEMNYGDLQFPESQILTVSNSESGTLSCQLSNGQAWLHVTPTEFSAPQDVSVSVDPTGLMSGTYDDTILIVSDNATNSPQHVPVTLNIVDVDAPIVSVGSSTHPVSAGDTLMVPVNAGDNLGITFNGSSSLPEVVTMLSISNQPSGSQFDFVSDGVSRFEWSPVPELTGTYYITVSADDGYQTSSIVVGIAINNIPQFTTDFSDKNIIEGEQLIFIVNATDNDGTQPIISWNRMPSAATFDSTTAGTGTLVFTPNHDDVDVTYEAIFTATDSIASVTDTLLIHVANRQLEVRVKTGEEDDDMLVTDSIVIEFNEAIDPSSLSANLVFSSAKGTTLGFQYVSDQNYLLIGAASGYLEQQDTIDITLNPGLKDLAGDSLVQSYVEDFVTGTAVYPGDANDDGIVDGRDILPMGLFWGNTGPIRSDVPDLSWTMSPGHIAFGGERWSPARGAHSDADGSGTIGPNDVCGVTDNWSFKHTIYEDNKSDNVKSLVTSLDMVDESVLQALYQAVIDCPETQGRSMLRESLESALGQSSTEAPLPTTVELYQNYPNPFNPSTTIRLYLPSSGKATLSIFNMLGRKVATLIDGSVNAGYIETDWDGTDQTGGVVASGIYFYRLETEDFSETRRMMMLK